MSVTLFSADVDGDTAERSGKVRIVDTHHFPGEPPAQAGQVRAAGHDESQRRQFRRSRLDCGARSAGKPAVCFLPFGIEGSFGIQGPFAMRVGRFASRVHFLIFPKGLRYGSQAKGFHTD
jgi:hypothetical protein